MLLGLLSSNPTRLPPLSGADMSTFLSTSVYS